METMSVVEQALVITVIGVVSIFAVLFILWGLMAGLVRVTAPRTSAQPSASNPLGDATPSRAAIAAITVARQRAAAVAVAVALALDAQSQPPAPDAQPVQSPISPWQATIRGNAMSRRAGVFRRNPPPQ